VPQLVIFVEGGSQIYDSPFISTMSHALWRGKNQAMSMSKWAFL
jgi:hypothetical protein